MDFIEYKSLVKEVVIGKQLPDAVYLHESAICTLPKKLGIHLARSLIDLKLDVKEWNILKIFKRDHKVTLLNYPTFFDDSYPALQTSFTVNLDTQTVREANYNQSENPPILHRKETFLSTNHPDIPLFKEITVEGEAIGLYEKTSRIGFKKNWEKLIKSKGYYLDKDGHLKPLTDKPITKKSSFNGTIERHKTAIDRNNLSQPMQSLARHGYLNSEFSVLDYGCGKGDDVRELEAHGLNVIGWDPTHRPDTQLKQHDIVNLGFVLNVIEDRVERIATLKKAWQFADKMLIVSVMIAGDNIINQFKPYKDGIITSRNTFQKYYSQGEFRYYIENTLNELSTPIGQGIFLLFKDKVEEQHFLSERQHIKRDWKKKTQRQLALKPKSIKKDVVEKHIELFTDYWDSTLELGSIHANNEFEFSDQIRRICGSHNKAHETLLKYFGNKIFDESQQKRREDLIVYFALSQFEKRKPQTQMPESLKRDIKAFFQSYNHALDESREILFSVGNPLTINKACNAAYRTLKKGLLEDSHSYTFHQKYLGDLPTA